MTNEANLRIFSTVPSGLVMERPVPGVKTPGYYRMALRDWNRRGKRNVPLVISDPFLILLFYGVH
jgi:hypothetical protein